MKLFPKIINYRYNEENMNPYAVIICLDSLPGDNQISELNSMGAFGGAGRVLYIQINMGTKRNILAQASNMLYESKFKEIAKGEWERKGISISTGEITVNKYLLRDGSLFVVAVPK
jgi:hypothetical protein